ncbi:hypothetical protein BV25DRAFT_1919383 [Artomyces pyxidatus]|uniref:Uncharacterized protein n=1 Tax=Artomyces pyxidatus TaxID=48021 RepID=A0ACB8SPA5_9AGAM|nr:hypothetical protein BV25DRAFT_1919383 [Artomyces pyxidatus]
MVVPAPHSPANHIPPQAGHPRRAQARVSLAPTFISPTPRAPTSTNKTFPLCALPRGPFSSRKMNAFAQTPRPRHHALQPSRNALPKYSDARDRTWTCIMPAKRISSACAHPSLLFARRARAPATFPRADEEARAPPHARHTPRTSPPRTTTYTPLARVPPAPPTRSALSIPPRAASSPTARIYPTKCTPPSLREAALAAFLPSASDPARPIPRPIRPAHTPVATPPPMRPPTRAPSPPRLANANPHPPRSAQL